MRRVARQPRTQQRLLTWHGAILVICASIVLSTWALASPPGSSPDDEFHLASIWCATGYSTGICEQTNDPEVIAIPKLIALDGPDKPCFVFRIETSGTCLFVGDVNALAPHPAARANSGLYPPIYYTVMRAFVTPKTLASATLMRLFNSALAVALLFATLAIARPATRRALAAATIVSLVPLGLFVIGSVNPSSWAVTGCLVAWAALLGFGENTTPTRRWLAGGLYLVGAGMAMAARADSVAYIGVITIAAIIASPELRAWGWRHRIIVGAIIGASILIVAGFLLRVDQAKVAFGAQGTFEAGDTTASIVERSFRNINALPGLMTGSFGTWPLGQLDAPVPTIVWALAFGAFASLILIGLGTRRAGKGWACGLILAAFALIPLFILVRGGLYVGQAIQPRYLLPLLPALVGIALLTRDRDAGLRLSRAQRATLVVATSIAQAAALHAVLRRYTVGTDLPNWNLDANVEWWWSWMPSPLLTWLVASIAFSYLAYRVFALFATAGKARTTHADQVPETIR